MDKGLGQAELIKSEISSDESNLADSRVGRDLSIEYPSQNQANLFYSCILRLFMK